MIIIYIKNLLRCPKKNKKKYNHLLLNTQFFRDINEDFFEEHYFNMFKYDNIHRNDYLFHSGEEKNSIYSYIIINEAMQFK